MDLADGRNKLTICTIVSTQYWHWTDSRTEW